MLPSVDSHSFSPVLIFSVSNRDPWDLVAPLDLLENLEMM